MELATYLEGLPEKQLDLLYTSPWTCRAVLHALTPLAQLYAARLLLPGKPLPAGTLDAWAAPKAQAKHRAAVGQLRRLGLLQDVLAGNRQPGCRLHPAFQQQLRAAMGGSAEPGVEPVPDDVAAAAPARPQLDAFAAAQWEGLLLYLGGNSRSPPAAPPELRLAAAGELLDVDDLLQAADLVAATPSGGRAVTQLGHRFLLRDAYGQLWGLLRPFVALQESESGAELASAVSFILQLGFRAPGRPLRLDGLAPEERRIAAALSQLGLLAPFRVGGQLWVSSTRLAEALAGSGGSSGGSGSGGGATVIVETNYRVYAYTDSELQSAVLRLFVRCEAVLPMLFVGTITRESVSSAIKKGLTASEMIEYFRLHAHPIAASRIPIVPEVVMDQIRLWEKEANRVRLMPATLYADFEDADLWAGTVAQAKLLGSHVWDAPPRPAGDDGTPPFRGALVSQAGAHAAVRDHIRELKKRASV